MEQVYIGTTNYGRHWLEPLAAASWFRMVADGCPAQGITDAGRTQAEQVAVFLKYFTTDYAASAKHDRRVWQGQVYWRRHGKPSAATPGSTQARHTYGRALDLNGTTKAWVRANGYRYGWIKDLVPGEDWHMEYQPGRDVRLTSTVVEIPGVSTRPPDVTPITPIAPVAPIEEDDDMPIIYDVPGKGLWLDTGAGELSGIGTTGAADGLTAAGIKRVPLPVDDWARLRAARAGREVVAATGGGFAVGTPGGRYVPLGQMAEVEHHRNAGCAERWVDLETFRNLTSA